MPSIPRPLRVPLAAPSALLLAAALAAPARALVAPATPAFEFAWGAYGTAPGLFNVPFFAAVDAQGDVYVADSGNNRVQKFDPLGNLLLQWGGAGSGAGQFNAAEAVAVDSTGNVYVSDWFNNRIQKFDANGGYLLQWGGAGSGNGQFNGPECIAVDAAGNVYVGDYFNNRIQRFTTAGVYVGQWGSPGAGNGQFANPEGIAIDPQGNVLVADSYNNRVQRFSPGGAFLGQFGSAGAGAGQFNVAGGLAVDAVGNVYVADINNQRIEKFDRTGAYLSQWGSSGSGNGQFSGLYGVAVDPAGNVIACDYALDRIQKFNSAGAAFTAGTPAFLTAWGAAGSSPGQFSGPLGVAADPSGRLYVADTGNNRVEVFSVGGVFLSQWGAAGNGAGQFNGPTAIAADANGRVFVADPPNSRVQVFLADGTYQAQWSGPNGHFGGLSGVAADGAGGAYVLAGADEQVYHVASNGSTLAQWGSSGTGVGQFNSPQGIAVDATGFVYVVDHGNCSVMKFTGDGTLVAQWGSPGTGPGQFGGPAGVAVGAGLVYVDDAPNDRIEVFTTTGLYVTQFGSPGSGAGSLANPAGLAIDANGDLLVADAGNNRIESFATPPAIAQVTDIARDQGGQVRVRFERSSGDGAGSPSPVLRYDVYRRIDALAPSLAARPGATPQDVTLAGWDLVANVYAHGDPEYDVVVPTLENATAAKSYYTAFFVRAVPESASRPPVDSGTENGWSIDNLTPPAPTHLAASYAAGATHLTWSSSPAPDFATFRLYRGASATFTPGPANLVASTGDSAYVDAGPAGNWYALSAVDVNGNEGPVALVGPGQTTAVPAAPLAFALAGVRPNPATGGRLAVAFTLPVASPARLELIDVAGRAVVTRDVGALGAGVHAVDLGAVRRVPPGLYFVRLTQGANTRSERVTVLD